MLRVPVTKPAEINLADIDKIAIGEITGNGSAILQDQLTTALFQSGRFELLDRQHLDKIFAEHNLTYSGAIDEATAAEIGKMLGSAALVFGRVSRYDYKEDMEYYDWEDRDGNSHRSYTRKGVANVAATLQVTDLRTGKIVAIKNLSSSLEEKKHKTDASPEKIDSDALLRRTCAGIVRAFMRAIAPYTVYEKVTLYTDKKIPDLKRGVAMSKIGNWAKAIEIFKAATEQFPTSSKAFFNLGVAYECSGNFVDAKTALEKAYEIEPKNAYLKEISRCDRLHQESLRLKEQLKK